MQYVRSISGSVSKTWNSINPATLSGAIDVIVVEQENGDLACSPFHVRFGKFSLLRPYEKKVEFSVNGKKADYSMKLGEGGEAFFVFETSSFIPAGMQTSPLVSPAGSPRSEPVLPDPSSLAEPEYLSIGDGKGDSVAPGPGNEIRRSRSDMGTAPLSNTPEPARPKEDEWSGISLATRLERARSEEVVGSGPRYTTLPRSSSPPPVHTAAAVERAITLSRKLSIPDLRTHVNEEGDVMLDVQGFKVDPGQRSNAEVLAQKLLTEEFEKEEELASLVGADRDGNLWIYSSEEAKQRANREEGISLGIDAVSDAGYASDEAVSDYDSGTEGKRHTQLSTPPSTPPDSPNPETKAVDNGKSYAKTLRLTSNQLKSLDLKAGANEITFTVNRASCSAFMYLWRYDNPIVISDIDGTITKSDALGHVFTMIGRDWTHLGVAKLYTDIVDNGYNIMYLTSRSVGLADTTRAYLDGIVQDTYRLPKGPVILSPDRTFSALRREVYLRKPEVFKMACLRDILNLFSQKHNPFYAGFGNRLTDALSYRSVNIPSTRIFTINSNAEVSLDLLCLTKYKSSYVNMRDLVDHFFPPVERLPQAEEFTDFNYWRTPVQDIDELTDIDSDGDDDAIPDDQDREDEDEGEEDEEEYDDDAEGDDEDEYSDDELAVPEEEPVVQEAYPPPTESERESPSDLRLAEADGGMDATPKVRRGGMKMDLNQSRLEYAKEFASAELAGIVEEVRGKLGAGDSGSHEEEREPRERTVSTGTRSRGVSHAGGSENRDNNKTREEERRLKEVDEA